MGRRILRVSGPARLTIIVALAIGFVLTIAAGIANAAITTPTAGSTVRGDVTISETQGGRQDLGCSSSGIGSKVWVIRESDQVQVHSATKSGTGTLTTTWVTHGLAAGSYRLRSETYDRFLGDFCSLKTNQKSNFLVTLDNLSALTYSGATSAFHDESFTATATLKDSTSNRVIVGHTVNFSLAGGSSTGSCVTNASGVCSATLSANPTPGTHTLTTSYAATAFWKGSSINTTFTVNKRPTTTTYTGDLSGTFDEDIDVSATLGDTRLGGAPIAGQLVTFKLKDGPATINTVTATTDATGLAATTMHLNAGGGTYVIEASYAGSSIYVNSAASQSFTVFKRASTLAYDGDTNGFWTEDAAVSATLTDTATGAAVPGRNVSFAIGSSSGSGSTDGSGAAGASLNLGDAPGGYTASASFAGDAFFLASTDSAAFSIDKRPSTLTYDGATSGTHNGSATLSATLTDTRNGQGVIGKTIDFTLGSFSASAVTDSSGQASVIAPMNQDAGSYTAAVSFDEDGFYLGSGDASAFAIGWEFAFADEDGKGTVFINTSNKQFAFVSTDGFDSGVVNNPGMQVHSLPGDVVVPEPGPLPEPPECADDPTGGEPFCPADYLPTPPNAAASQETCVEDPTGGEPVCVEEAPAPCDPENIEACVPPVEPGDPPCDPENIEACVPPVEPPCGGEDCIPPVETCDPNDPQGCLPQPMPSACDIPQTTGCHERFVTIVYNSESFSLSGFFDLETGRFVAVATTASNSYLLRRLSPPAPPCSGEDCIPPVEPPCSGEDCIPPVEPPCSGEDCIPPVEAPCSGEDCIPPVEPGDPPSTPECVENPLGDPVCP